MSAAPTAAAQTTDPDPHRDRPAVGTDAPTRFGHLLCLVRMLIDYGKELVGALQQGAPVRRLTSIARDFGTVDIALILSCITRALHRAAALEARFIERANRKERPVATGARTQRQPRTVQPAEQTDPAHEPTLEDILARDRRRPIGAVIADICRDLRIVASNPLWQQLRPAIDDNAGNLRTLLTDMVRRCCAFMVDPAALALAGWPAPCAPLPAASGAGPP